MMVGGGGGGRERRRASRIWLCVGAFLLWGLLVAIILTMDFSSDVRLIVFMVVTLICLVPVALHRPHAARNRHVVSSSVVVGSDADFASAFLNAIRHASRTDNLQFPSAIAYLSCAAAIPSSPAKPFMGGLFIQWLCCSERNDRPGRRSRGRQPLSLLLEMSDGAISGFGSGPCEVSGRYQTLLSPQSLVIVAFALRFQDHERQFRGIADDLSLGMRGAWAMTSARGRSRRGWWRAWPVDAPIRSVRLFVCDSDDTKGECVLCLEENSTKVACLPCGHVIACWQCISAVPLCPACRQPITRVEDLDMTPSGPALRKEVTVLDVDDDDEDDEETIAVEA
ncbi:RING-type domain-containing protein [Plasmodiophora brassicae]|uniref:RING-type domain-containing protein n=1 Tax=Plasmodiophora brassicae TaxID=37360 RepID=A0A0G4ITR6_PLABS|nr:hypothetical protein PBRA_006739 [Plasmodiophora brassicae]SPR00759.1 unnamed protein product [Plasmodiophora brassicae]